jgi:hypothetical protein
MYYRLIKIHRKDYKIRLKTKPADLEKNSVDKSWEKLAISVLIA